MEETKKIFQVVSNLKISGVFHQAGAFIEGEIEAFEVLVKDGVLRLMEDATDIESAQAIIDAEKKAAEEKAEQEKEEAPKDTWAATKPEDAEKKAADVTALQTKAEQEAIAKSAAKKDAAEATATNTEVKTEKFTVAKEFTITNTKSSNYGTHKVGDVITADPVKAKGYIDSGVIVPFVEPTEDGSNL